MKEKLRKKQPVAYRILENALLGKTSAHAYLFFGDKGCGKFKSAILLAQSLLCEKEGFACEKCDVCRRVAENNFSDLIIIDGSIKTIKKEDIMHIQEEFNKTALEATGKKIYILNLVENATADVMNSLLKFLEEPASDVTAILISEQLDKVLPTIVSRCQKIPFRKPPVKEGLEFARNEDIDELDAYLCSHIAADADEIIALSEDENYRNARDWAMEVIEHFYDDPYMTLLTIQTQAFNEKKGNDRNQFAYFNEILTIFFRNGIMQKSECKDDIWNMMIGKYSKEQCVEYLNICVSTKNRFSKSVSVKLLVDSMLIRMKEVADGE